MAAAWQSSSAPPPPSLAQLAILPLNGLGGAAAFEAAAAAAASAPSGDAPFTSAAFDEADEEASERRLAATVLGGAPFVVDLAELRAGAAGSGSSSGGSPASFGAVADVAFLHGYGYAPALALLEHRVLTSASRLGSAAHTAVLSVVAVDAAEARVTAVWGRDGLPHDCFGLVPVPAPAGAALRGARDGGREGS